MLFHILLVRSAGLQLMHMLKARPASSTHATHHATASKPNMANCADLLLIALQVWACGTRILHPNNYKASHDLTTSAAFSCTFAV